MECNCKVCNETVSKLRAERDVLLAACKVGADDYPEINFCNYDDEDVQNVQEWAFGVIDACRAAIAAAEGSETG